MSPGELERVSWAKLMTNAAAKDCPTTGTLVVLETHELHCAKIHADLALARRGTAVVELQKQVEHLKAELNDLVEEMRDIEVDFELEREEKEEKIFELTGQVEQLDEALELYQEGSMWSDAAQGFYWEQYLENVSDVNVDDRITMRDDKICKLQREVEELRKRCELSTREEELEAIERLEAAKVGVGAGIVMALKRKLQPYVEIEVRGGRAVKVAKVEDGRAGG